MLILQTGFQSIVIVHTGTRRKGGALLVISKLNFFATNYIQAGKEHRI